MGHDKDPDPRNEENKLKTIIDESCHLKPANAKIISNSLQGPIEESQSPERSSPEQHAQPVAQGDPLADNVSTDDSKVQEETSTIDRMASPSSGDAQNVNVSRKDEMSETRDDNPVIGHTDGDENPENSKSPGMENSALGETFKRNADSFSKPHVDSLDGGSKIDKLVSEKDRVSDSELQHASVSSTKLISIANKRMSTLPNNPALEKREGLNANNTKLRNELMKTAVAHDTGPTTDETVSRGNDQNSEHINAIRSDVHAANSVEQSKFILPHITMKRKAPEESAAIPRFRVKRLSASPSNPVRASPQKVVEEQVCDHASVAHDKSPRINAPQTEMDISMAHDKSPTFDVSEIEMDISSSVDDDSIAEKAFEDVSAVSESKLPLEIHQEILLRMEANELVQCKRVCKLWNYVISSGRFVKAHLNNNIKKKGDRDTRISLTRNWRMSKDHHGEYLKYDGWGILTTSNMMHYKCHLVGSSDGLVCISLKNTDFLVINMSTREVKELENPLQRFHRCSYNQSECVSGFGRDMSTDDYKVVIGSKTEDGYEFYLLVLKSNFWRSVVAGKVRYRSMCKDGILSNGSIHWLAYDKNNRGVVVCFDLSTELFTEISLLPNMDECYFLSLGTIKEHLCIIGNPKISSEEDEKKQIWVMKDKQQQGSWEIFLLPRVYNAERSIMDFIPRGNFPYGYVHIWLLEDGESAPHRVQSIRLKRPDDDGHIQLCTNRLCNYNFDQHVYVKTLVSPNNE